MSLENRSNCIDFIFMTSTTGDTISNPISVQFMGTERQRNLQSKEPLRDNIWIVIPFKQIYWTIYLNWQRPAIWIDIHPIYSNRGRTSKCQQYFPDTIRRLLHGGILNSDWSGQTYKNTVCKLALDGASGRPVLAHIATFYAIIGNTGSKAGGKAGVSSTATAWHAISLPSAYTKNKGLLWAVPPTLNFSVHFPNCT